MSNINANESDVNCAEKMKWRHWVALIKQQQQQQQNAVWMAFDEHTEWDRPQETTGNNWMERFIHLWVITHSAMYPLISFQFLIYASYFVAISLLFTVRGVCTVLRMKSPCGGNQAETASDRPEGSRPWGLSETLKSMRTFIISVIGSNQQKKVRRRCSHTCSSERLWWSYLSVCHQQGAVPLIVKVQSGQAATRGHYLYSIKQVYLYLATLRWFNLNTEMFNCHSVFCINYVISILSQVAEMLTLNLPFLNHWIFSMVFSCHDLSKWHNQWPLYYLHFWSFYQ